MSDSVIGRGVIEVTADSTKLKAGIDDAKRSINGMGDAAEKNATRSSRAIDKYIKDLQTQNATVGKSARETDAYKLALRGATNEQLAAADAAHRLAEAHEKGARIGNAINLSIAALAAGSIAAAVAFDHLVKKAGDFQDLSEKTGDSAENIASLAVAAGTAGFEMKSVGDLAVKLSKNLVGVDDDSAAAGAAVKALGLNMADLKNMQAADRLETIAKAFNGFADGATKGDVAIALFGKAGAEALPFLKELGQEGARQNILTNEQIRLADDYADKSAKLRTQISLYAQSLAIEAIPSLNNFTDALKLTIAGVADTGKATSELARNDSIAKFADSSVMAFSYLIDGATGVYRSIEILITSVGRMGHAANLVGKGEFAEAAKYAKESEAVYQKILDRPILTTAVQLRIANRQIAHFNREEGNSNDNYYETPDSYNQAPKKLNFNGAMPKDKPKVVDPNKMLNAQLNLDIANIRKAGAEQIEAYANTERTMQALYSVGLYTEDEYFSAKRRFLEGNTAAQETALKEEIARLEEENRAGKNKLDNDRKIVEAKKQLDKVSKAGKTALEVNSIEQKAANDRIKESFDDATKAAERYLATISKQTSRDLAGIGKGEKFRQDQAARGGIDDRRDAALQGYKDQFDKGHLTEEKFKDYTALVNGTYANEVQAYNDRTAALELAQGDWLNGAKDAWNDYADHAKNVAAQSSAAFTSAFEGMTNGVSDSIARTIVRGDNLGESLKNVALSISENFISAFIKIGIQKLLTDKVAASAYATTIAAQSQAMVAMASLNAFASTAAIPVVGPALAPGAALAAGAAAEGFAALATAAATLSVASAAGGFDIPAGVNPLTQLHEREMVLPARHADTIRRLGSMGDGGGNIEISMQTIIQNGAASTTVVGGNGTQAREMGDALNAKFRQVIATEMRQGGLLWNMKQGRA